MPGGRPRKPTALKIVEGNRGKRPIKPEPQPAQGAPAMPEGMPVEAQQIWISLIGELDRLGVLTQIDGVTLEGACRGAAEARWADHQRAKLQERIDQGEEITQQVVYQLSVLTSLSKKGWQQWKSFGTEMGLSPASRGRLSVRAVENAVDPLEAALCG